MDFCDMYSVLNNTTPPFQNPAKIQAPMNPFNKKNLPSYINESMRNKALETHRQDTVLEVSGSGLEIGFGSGLNLPYYKNITKLIALEPSKELYELTEIPEGGVSFQIEYLEASAESIPLPDNSQDFVVSTWSLCSIPHPEVALTEVLRVLKPGGTFAFIEHGKSPNTCISFIQHIGTPITKYCAGGCHMNRNIEQLILDAGFQIKKLEKFRLPSKPLAYMYKGVAGTKK